MALLEMFFNTTTGRWETEAPAPAFGASASLLHFEGTDAGVVFTNSGADGATYSAVGNAQTDTAQFKFNASSLLLDGSGDYILSTTVGALPSASPGWTIDFWVRPHSSLEGGLFSYMTSTQYRGVTLSKLNTDKLSLSLSSDGASQDIANNQQSTNTLALDTWAHVAVVRDVVAGKYYVYKNGVKEIEVASATNITNTDDRIRIGDYNGSYLNGWIDEFRITHTCEWPGGTTFTPPVAPYTT